MSFTKKTNPKILVLLFVIAGWLQGCQETIKPVASFAVDQDHGTSPLTVQFTNTSTDAVRYEWAFGDGTFSEEMSPEHTFDYHFEGFKEKFTVVLTAYGEGGESDKFSTVITAKKNVPTTNPKDSDLDIMVDTTVMNYFDEPFICGLSMAIIDGKETHIYQYGETAHGSGVMPTETTLYKIASVTKPFTAIALLYWLNQQDISMDAPVKDYLPDDLAPGLSKDGVDITFRHLLSHTSGLPLHPSNMPRNDPFATYDSTDLYEYIKGEVLIRTPGTLPAHYDAWNNSFYSNVAFGLIGVLLERNCKMNLQTIFNQTILQPYNMSNTEIKYIEGLPGAASGNNMNSLGNNYSPIYYHFQGLYGCGGLASNLKDLIQFAQSLMAEDGNTELGAAVMKSFKDQYELVDAPFAGIKLFACLPWGSFLQTNGDTFFAHMGGATGYSTLFSVDVQNNRAMIILNNNYFEDNDFGGHFTRFRTAFYASSP